MKLMSQSECPVSRGNTIGDWDERVTEEILQ